MGEGPLVLMMNGDLVWRVDEVTAPNHLSILSVEEARDDHLRLPDDTGVEDTRIARLIAAARMDAQFWTGMALGEQTLKYVADRFPLGCEWLTLPYPPVTRIVSVEYIGTDGVLTDAGSPAPFEESLPSGPNPMRARLRPVYGTNWPTTQASLDAVQVTYEAGFTGQNVPASIIEGMLLVIGELYKQRSESVHALNQNPAVIRARNLWSRLKRY